MTKKDQKPQEKLEVQLQKEVEEKSKVIADYENTLKRLQADFENYVKRVEQEKQNATKYAVAKILTKIVHMIDDLDRSLQILENTQDKEINTGIQMIHKQFHKILQEEGIKPFDSKGKKLDPYQHEVIEMVAHDSPEGTVIEEVQKGYVMHDKILRTAKVRVSKGKQK